MERDFLIAVAMGDLNKVKYYLNRGINPSIDNNYAICEASKRGHIGIVKLLLIDKRVDPSVKNNYCIKCSSRNGHIEIVKLLLKDKRVDPSADDNYSIWWAYLNDHNEVIKLLYKDSRVRDGIREKYMKSLENSDKILSKKIEKIIAIKDLK